MGLSAIEIAKNNGVKIGHGSDLLGECQVYQSDELSIKAEVVGNYEAIRHATEVNAEILNMTGELGVIKENALADILIVDGNPIKDVGFLSNDAKFIPIIMKDGRLYKNTQ